MPLDGDVLNNNAESDRDDGEIDAFDPHRRIGEQHAERPGKDCRADAGRNDVKAEPRGEDRSCIGSQREQARLPQRNQACKTHQNIQTYCNHAVDQKQHEKPQRIFVSRHQRDGGKDEGKDEKAERNEVSHTLRTSRLPNRPCGKTSSTRIMTPKPMISRAAVEI